MPIFRNLKSRDVPPPHTPQNPLPTPPTKSVNQPLSTASSISRKKQQLNSSLVFAQLPRGRQHKFDNVNMNILPATQATKMDAHKPKLNKLSQKVNHQWKENSIFFNLEIKYTWFLIFFKKYPNVLYLGETWSWHKCSLRWHLPEIVCKDPLVFLACLWSVVTCHRSKLLFDFFINLCSTLKPLTFWSWAKPIVEDIFPLV